MNWHIWKCSGIVCSCSTERGIRERENEMSGIVIEKVRKSFDTKDGVVEALKDVNLNIDSGDIYGIIGMSGAGKSTLVRCMNFLEVPTEGQVLIDGKRCFSSVKCIRASSPAPINPTVSTFLGAKYLAATHPTAAVRSCVQSVPSITAIGNPVSISDNNITPVTF